MKALSIGAAALSIALIAQPAAAATTLSFRATDNGVATGLTGSTSGGVLLIEGSSTNFTLAGNAASAPALPSPNFSTNTFNLLTNASAGTKTLVLEVTATGLTSFTGGLMNTFTLNSLTGGSFISGTISHYLDASNTAYGMGTLVGTSTFSGLSSFNSSSSAAASLTGPFSETAVYTLTFGGGTAGAVSASSQLSAVPEPATWAMMLVGFGFVGATMRRRKQSVRVRFA